MWAGTLQLTGPIEQVSGSTLTGGAWRTGQFENPGTSVLNMVNHSIATIGEDATVTILRGGSFPQLLLRENYGYFVLRRGGTYETPEALANYGRMDLADDITTRLIVNGATFLNNGRLYIARNATVQVGYEFDCRPGSTTEIEGTLDGRLVSLNGGMFFGSGTVNGELMKNVVCKLGPGRSPGFMTINADYLQADTASLEIELAGEVPGTGHDQLVIHGNATLAGTLIILPVGGFLPQVGQTYEFLTADGGTITGEFDNVVGPGEYDITYGVGGVTATVLVRPGDSDGDEDVDLLEHRDFVSCMSGPVGTVDVGCTTFDFNANDTVDLQDWCVFQNVFTGSAP